MTVLILIIAALIFLAGVVIIINPECIFGLLRTNIERLELHILAVVARLVLGALLIDQSSISRFPLAIEIIGWLSVVAAIVLALMGRRNFKRLMTWALSVLKPYGRVGGILASAFAAFLVYAFI